MTAAALSEEDLAQRDALVGRLLAATIGALELLNVYVGDCLGLYRALADRGRSSRERFKLPVGITPERGWS